jgi:hypothetical protein
MLQRGATLRAVSSVSNHHDGKQTPGIVGKHPEINNLDDGFRRVVTGELVHPVRKVIARDLLFSSP